MGSGWGTALEAWAVTVVPAFVFVGLCEALYRGTRAARRRAGR